MPARACTRSEPSSSSRAGSGASKSSGSIAGSSNLPSRNSRALPDTDSRSSVVTVTGSASSMRRNTSTLTLSLAAVAAASLGARSHSRPCSILAGAVSPPITRSTSTLCAGIASDCGVSRQSKLPRSSCSPRSSHSAGRPSRGSALARRPSTCRFCGHSVSSPGSVCQPAASTSTCCVKLPPRAPTDTVNRPGH